MQNTQDALQHKASAAAVLERFLEASPKEAAQTLEALPLSEAVFWASSLKARGIIAALENMAPQKAAVLLRRLPFKQAAHIILNLNSLRAGELFAALPPHYKQKLAADMEPAQAKNLEAVLSYPQGSAGRLMGGGYFIFKTEAKAKDIILKLKTLPKNKIPFCVYINDKSGRLAGIVKTAELALYSQEAAAGAIMNRAFEKLAAAEPAQAAQAKFTAAGAPVLPVLDAEGSLVGVLTAARVWPAAQPPCKTGVKRTITAAFVTGFFAAVAFYLLLVWIFL
ncbi:MAG: hypothetical protein LBL61_06145 [Elusimicrobiota bacterium]|jgi:magnesium transporter|nr:hypothetical protein [Elusimicrobiota bacterium]